MSIDYVYCACILSPSLIYACALSRNSFREGLVTILALAVDVQDQGSLHGGQAQHGEALQIVLFFFNSSEVLDEESGYSRPSSSL